MQLFKCKGIRSICGESKPAADFNISSQGYRLGLCKKCESKYKSQQQNKKLRATRPLKKAGRPPGKNSEKKNTSAKLIDVSNSFLTGKL